MSIARSSPFALTASRQARLRDGRRRITRFRALGLLAKGAEHPAAAPDAGTHNPKVDASGGPRPTFWPSSRKAPPWTTPPPPSPGVRAPIAVLGWGEKSRARHTRQVTTNQEASSRDSPFEGNAPPPSYHERARSWLGGLAHAFNEPYWDTKAGSPACPRALCCNARCLARGAPNL